MKKLLSLILVLCLIFALAPAAYADSARWDDVVTMEPDEQVDFLKTLISSKHVAIQPDWNWVFWYGDEADGILGGDGHLLSCKGGAGCNCEAVLLEAEKEGAQQKYEQDLKVWIKTKRDADNVRNDTIVAELEVPYNLKNEKLNQEYLDGKDAVKKAFADFCDEDKMAEKLYRGTDFIHVQVRNSLDYVENQRSSGVSHVLYEVMNPGPWPITGVGLDFYNEHGRDGGKEYIISRDGLGTEHEYDIAVKLGSLVVALPESIGDGAFSMGVSFNYDGSVRVMLCDDAGKLIPGAVVVAALPEGAGDDTVAATVDASGNLSEISSSVEKGSIAFTAPSGDDVFALK